MNTHCPFNFRFLHLGLNGNHPASNDELRLFIQLLLAQWSYCCEQLNFPHKNTQHNSIVSKPFIGPVNSFILVPEYFCHPEKAF